MTLTIARHEFAQFLRDGRLRWAAVLVFALLLVSVASGVRYQRALAAERASAQAVENARWLGQGHKNPHSAAHYGLYAFKPASPLTAIDQGVEPFVGVSVWLEAHKMNDFVHRPAQDGTALARFGELTAALTLQVLLPLLIVLLAFGAFAAERERGTLRQLLALGVAPRALVSGKLLGVTTALGLVLAPATLLALAALVLHTPSELPLHLGRFALIAAAYFAYLAIFLFVALAISARVATARNALVALLGFWMLTCLALPRAVADLAATLHPAPSAAAFRQSLAANLGATHSSDRALAVRARVMKQYSVTRPEDLPIDWRGISLMEEEEHNFPIFDRAFGELFDTYRAQDRVLQLAAAVSPLLAVQSLSQALTGTDFEHHRRFVFAAEQQRRVIQKITNNDVTLHDREGTDYRAGPELWAQVPEFYYASPSLREILPHYAIAGATLLAWLAAAAWAALRATATLKP